MKCVSIIAALAGLALAAPAPVPQDFDLDAVLAAPAPDVTEAPVGTQDQASLAYDAAAAATTASAQASTAVTASITGTATAAAATTTPTSDASQDDSSDDDSSSGVSKRSACQVQPAGSGPTASPDTAQGFAQYPPFHATANVAAVQAPFPYVNTFRDLNGSTQGNSYLTYFVQKSYNVSECAAHCDKNTHCTAFNLYFERDPSVDPGAGCEDPPSTTNIKCALWGSNIDASSATNTGQYRGQFHVVIAGSNGYDKTNNTLPAVVPGFTISANLSGTAISAGGSFFLGASFFPGPFDPTLCGVYAQAQTAKNKAWAQFFHLHYYTPVNMFNAYTVFKSGVAQGTYCSLFDTNLSVGWAMFSGIWSGGFFFGVQNSWTYVLTVPDNGHI